MSYFSALFALFVTTLADAASLKTSATNGLVAKASSAAEKLLRGAEAAIHHHGGPKLAPGQEFYTTNTACLPHYCLNPVIPGLMHLGENVLDANKKKPWTCATISNTKVLFKLGGFCSRVLA